MRLLELGCVAVEVGPLVLPGVEASLYEAARAGTYRCRDGSTGPAYEAARAGKCRYRCGSTGSAWGEGPV
jgi:hypothetical protein